MVAKTMQAEEAIAISRGKKNHTEDATQRTTETRGYERTKDQIYDGNKCEGNAKEYNKEIISDGQEHEGNESIVTLKRSENRRSDISVYLYIYRFDKR